MRQSVRVEAEHGWVWMPREFAFDPTTCVHLLTNQRLGDLVEITEIAPPTL